MTGAYAIVKFGPGFEPEEQAKALFFLEKRLREVTGKDIRIYKDLMGDDSRLRREMTPEQREKL